MAPIFSFAQFFELHRTCWSAVELALHPSIDIGQERRETAGLLELPRTLARIRSCCSSKRSRNALCPPRNCCAPYGRFAEHTLLDDWPVWDSQDFGLKGDFSCWSHVKEPSQVRRECCSGRQEAAICFNSEFTRERCCVDTCTRLAWEFAARFRGPPVLAESGTSFVAGNLSVGVLLLLLNDEDLGYTPENLRRVGCDIGALAIELLQGSPTTLPPWSTFLATPWLQN